MTNTMSKLEEAKAKLEILKMEEEILKLEMDIVIEKYALELICKEAFDQQVDIQLSKQTDHRSKMFDVSYSIEYPHQIVWGNGEKYNKEGFRI